MDEIFEDELEGGLRGALALTVTPSLETLSFAVELARLLPRPDRPSLIARLISGGQPLAAARGGEAQQRLYETDRHLITLWDEADVNASRYLIGQVYDKASGPLVPQEVMLLSPSNTELRAQQEGSEFHLPQIAPGTYALRCALESTDILLTGVEVGD